MVHCIEDLTQVIISYGIYKTSLGESNKFHNEMLMSVRFCLSYGLLNMILWPSKFVYFNENLHCCNGCRHDVTCSRQKCYVTCGHSIIYDMRLSTE